MFKETFHEIIEKQNKNITINSFIEKIKKYQSLEQALIELPQEYLEFYVNNEKEISKAVKRLFESQETQGYLGYAPPQETKTKVIKYKGQLIHLKWDDDSKNWVPMVAFRNILSAVRYGKKLVDEI